MASRATGGSARPGTPPAATRPAPKPAPSIASRTAGGNPRAGATGAAPNPNARPITGGRGGSALQASANRGGAPVRASRPISNANRNPVNPRATGGSGGGAAGVSRGAPRIQTVASRAQYNPRGGAGFARAGGSAGGGGIQRGGGGGYGVWRHASYDHHNHRSHYVYPSFAHSVNYAYRPSYWGYRPWWGSSYSHSWHHGCWNYGWNNNWNSRYAYYRRPSYYYPPGYRTYYTSASSFVPWGLASWTLGSLAYDTGYYSYHNPYVAPPVNTHTTVIRYAEPITVVASNYEPATEEIAETAAEKSSAALERSRQAFSDGDYLAAASAVDEAIAHTPGDPVLHEFRALTLFALGRYDDAAGVLHSVLASGPGWDWDTLIGFYGDADRYTDQLRRLEDYVVANPDSAAPHLLLGYHYMVGENLTEAHGMFDRVATLQPNDSVARQLKSLLNDSVPAPAPGPMVSDGTEPTLVEPDKTPIAAESLHGIWRAPSADGKNITLSLTAIGTFTWNYEGATAEVLSGEWSLDKDGLLVLADEDVQMVGDITLNSDGSLHFLLAGSPEGDPGLTFRKE